MEGDSSPFFRPLHAERLIKANAVGRSSKTVREFLEKNHKDDMDRADTIKLTVKSLLEVVQTGAKNIEITVMESFGNQTVRAPWRSASFEPLMPYGRASPCKRSKRLFQRLKGRRSRVSLPPISSEILLKISSFHRGRTEEEPTGSHNGRTSFHVVEGTGSAWTVIVVMACTESLALCNNLNFASTPSSTDDLEFVFAAKTIPTVTFTIEGTESDSN